MVKLTVAFILVLLMIVETFIEGSEKVDTLYKTTKVKWKDMKNLEPVSHGWIKLNEKYQCGYRNCMKACTKHTRDRCFYKCKCSKKFYSYRQSVPQSCRKVLKVKCRNVCFRHFCGVVCRKHYVTKCRLLYGWKYEKNWLKNLCFLLLRSESS